MEDDSTNTILITGMEDDSTNTIPIADMEDDSTNTIPIAAMKEDPSPDLISNELADSKSTVSSLESQIAGLSRENTDLSLQIQELRGQVKGFDSVLARASSLEGDVARLQHDLISSMCAADESSTENQELRLEKKMLAKRVKELEAAVDKFSTENEELKVENQTLSGRVKDLEDSLAAKGKNIVELEAAVKGLEEERMEAGEKFEEMVRVLQEKLGKVVKELEDKEGEINKAKGLAADAISEVELLQTSMEKMMEGEIVNEEANGSAVDEERKKGIEERGIGFKYLPCAATAVSVGIVSAAVTAFCLRYSRDR